VGKGLGREFFYAMVVVIIALSFAKELVMVVMAHLLGPNTGWFPLLLSPNPKTS